MSEAFFWLYKHKLSTRIPISDYTMTVTGQFPSLLSFHLDIYPKENYPLDAP